MFVPTRHTGPLPSSVQPAPPLLQRKCACGRTPGPTGACAACRRQRKLHAGSRLQPKLRVNTPGDRYEREADRVADAVTRGGLAQATSAGPPLLQRQEPPAPGAKTNEDKYKEAAEKTAEALLETETGKKIKDKAEEVATSLPGLVIIGSAAAGIVTKAAIKNEALPFQPPEVPLDKVGLPGVKMQLTWEGPLRNPTKAVIGFSGTFGAGAKKETPQSSRAEQQRAENARRAEEQRRFRERLKTPEQRAAEEAAVMQYVVQQVQDPGSPLYIPGLKPSAEAPPLVPKAEDQEAGAVQREAAGPTPATAPPVVHEVLHAPGRPLDPATRHFMEQRFGHDFSQVRVHTDARAAASAQAVRARAYTVGRDVVFGAGAYRPGTTAGQHLLAHELTHVVQQGAGAAQWVQRAPDDKAKAAPRRDVAALLSDEPNTLPTATAVAPGAHQIQAGTPEELAAALKKIDFPIGTLYFFSHSLPSGDLGFSRGNTTSFVLPSKVAAALKGSISAANAPQHVDFRGCSLGTSPEGMDQIRSALGAGSAVGGNCFMIQWVQGPVLLGNEEITQPSQVKAEDQESFEQGLSMLADLFGEAKDCILDTSKEAYFRTGGKYVAIWSNSEYDTTWNKRKSVCYKDLSTETATLPTTEDFSPGLAGRCKLVRVEQHAQQAPPAEKKPAP